MKRNLANLANFGGNLANFGGNLANLGEIWQKFGEFWQNCNLASEFGLLWLILA